MKTPRETLLTKLISLNLWTTADGGITFTDPMTGDTMPADRAWHHIVVRQRGAYPQHWGQVDL